MNSNKVILISIDGMRPDGVVNCGNPYVAEMMKKGAYTLTAQTVIPSVTLPCHTSMFHSVTPERHGTTTNTYMPQAIVPCSTAGSLCAISPAPLL